VVVLWLQCQNDPAEGASLDERFVRLASASDIVVVDNLQYENSLLATGAADTARTAMVPPAVSLADYSPGPVDSDLRRNLNLLGKRVLLAQLPLVGATSVLNAATALLDGVQSRCSNAVLLIAWSTQDIGSASGSVGGRDDVLILPPDADLRSVYRLADLFLETGYSCTARQHALEAMACGTPVLGRGPEGSYSEESALKALCDDAAYGKLVRNSLETATDHSLESFAEAWSEVLAKACGWLPVRLTPESSSGKQAVLTGSGGVIERTDAASAAATLGIDLEQLKTLANVTLPDYEVRSPTPMFGPLIAWIRRNLTSHLRKPYLDPTLDRQEAFNLRAANVLEDLAHQLAAYERTVGERAARSAAVNARVLQLQEKAQGELVAILDTDGIDATTRAQVDAVLTVLERMRPLLQGSGVEKQVEGLKGD
jgi:hypothetical protein